MEITTITIIPIVSAIVEALKRAIDLNPRYIPLASILVSVLLCVVSNLTSIGWKEDLVMGIVFGLSASGLYDIAKKTTLNK